MEFYVLDYNSSDKDVPKSGDEEEEEDDGELKPFPKGKKVSLKGYNVLF